MLQFDEKGFLIPYEVIPSDWETFSTTFTEGIRRNSLTENLELYFQNFQKEISPVFKVWVNGSFVTQKVNPEDIDFVIF